MLDLWFHATIFSASISATVAKSKAGGSLFMSILSFLMDGLYIEE